MIFKSELKFKQAQAQEDALDIKLLHKNFPCILFKGMVNFSRNGFITRLNTNGVG